MKTFQEWSNSGYKIKKGSKGIKVGDNFYFTEQQVQYSPRYSYNATFRGCAPKGTGAVWYLEEDEELEYHQLYPT